MSYEDEIVLHPFAAAIVKHLKDQEVELYCGDIKTTMQFHDFNIQQKNVIRGTIKDATGDAIIIECNRNGKTGIVFLNVWSIKTIIRVEDPLFMADIFEDEQRYLQEKRKKRSE